METHILVFERKHTKNDMSNQFQWTANIIFNQVSNDILEIDVLRDPHNIVSHLYKNASVI